MDEHWTLLTKTNIGETWYKWRCGSSESRIYTWDQVLRLADGDYDPRDPSKKTEHPCILNWWASIRNDREEWDDDCGGVGVVGEWCCCFNSDEDEESEESDTDLR